MSSPLARTSGAKLEKGITSLQCYQSGLDEMLIAFQKSPQNRAGTWIGLGWGGGILFERRRGTLRFTDQPGILRECFCSRMRLLFFFCYCFFSLLLATSSHLSQLLLVILARLSPGLFCLYISPPPQKRCEWPLSSVTSYIQQGSNGHLRARWHEAEDTKSQIKRHVGDLASREASHWSCD